jgi:hypothetical protein
MPIEVLNIEEAKGIAQEFLQAYKIFEQTADENRRELNKIIGEDIRRETSLRDRGRDREADKVEESAKRHEGRIGENRRYFWDEHLGPVSKKYGLSLHPDNSIVGFNIEKVGYAEFDLANPTGLYTLKTMQVPKWHGFLGHKQVVEKKPLATLQ